MRKEYINPAICTMRIETVCMTAASLPKGEGTLGDDDKDVFLGRERRSHDVWGEDEEE